MEDLTQLPYHRNPVKDEWSLRIWGENVVLAECHQSGENPDDRYTNRQGKEKGTCRYCGGTFTLDAGKLPRHARQLDMREQVEQRIQQVAAVLELDPWSEPVMKATAAARERRDGGYDLALAEALPHLTSALIMRGAAKESTRAVKALKELKVGDETETDLTTSPYYAQGDEDAPFMSEAFLYSVLGKEAARSVLERFKDLERSVGEG